MSDLVAEILGTQYQMIAELQWAYGGYEDKIDQVRSDPRWRVFNRHDGAVLVELSLWLVHSGCAIVEALR